MVAQKRISSVSDRDELFAGTMSDLDRNSTDQRQRLLDSNARMEASNVRLKEAIAIGNETGALATPWPWLGAAQPVDVTVERANQIRSWSCPCRGNWAKRAGHPRQPARAARTLQQDGTEGRPGTP